MIGVTYGEPWNCPEDPPEPRIIFKVDMGPPVDLRRRLLYEPVIFEVEEPTREQQRCRAVWRTGLVMLKYHRERRGPYAPAPKRGWRDWLRSFMLALAEGTEP